MDGATGSKKARHNFCDLFFFNRPPGCISEVRQYGCALIKRKCRSEKHYRGKKVAISSKLPGARFPLYLGRKAETTSASAGHCGLYTVWEGT